MHCITLFPGTLCCWADHHLRPPTWRRHTGVSERHATLFPPPCRHKLSSWSPTCWPRYQRTDPTWTTSWGTTSSHRLDATDNSTWSIFPWISKCGSLTVTFFPRAAHWPTFLLCRASVQSVCRLAAAIQHQISTSPVPPRASSRKLLLHCSVEKGTRSNTTRLWVSIIKSTACIPLSAPAVAPSL